MKGQVAKCDHREYGFANLVLRSDGAGVDALFENFGDEMQVCLLFCFLFFCLCMIHLNCVFV